MKISYEMFKKPETFDYNILPTPEDVWKTGEIYLVDRKYVNSEISMTN
jgi:hypothetical protein